MTMTRSGGMTPPGTAGTRRGSWAWAGGGPRSAWSSCRTYKHTSVRSDKDLVVNTSNTCYSLILALAFSNKSSIFVCYVVASVLGLCRSAGVAHKLFLLNLKTT